MQGRLKTCHGLLIVALKIEDLSEAKVRFAEQPIEISLDGYAPSTSAFSGTLASAISLATAPDDHLIGAVTGGTYVVTGVTRSSTSEDFKRIAVKAKYSPTIIA